MRPSGQRAHRHGFSAIELIMAIALSGILVVGLTVMIDVPNQMAATQDGDNPSVASADVALSALERDIRFATNTTTPSSREIELHYSDGKTVRWAFSGTRGESLRRADSEGSVDVVRSVADITIRLRTEKMIVRESEDQPTTISSVVLGSFSSFALQPGFAFGTTPLPGITLVSELTELTAIDGSNRAGVYVSPVGLADSDAIPTLVRVGLQRNGSGNLLVNLYEAKQSGTSPERTNLVASGVLWNRQIPVALSAVDIPLLMQKKMKKNRKYFIEFLASGSSSAAKIEGRTLSRPAAASSQPNVFLRSADGGSNFSGLVTTLDASQTLFSLEAVQVAIDFSGLVTTPLPPGYREIEVTVGAGLVLTLVTPTGDQSVTAAFPLENNVALVNR